MKTKQFTLIAATLPIALAVCVAVAPKMASADQYISAMIPVLNRPDQPRTLLTVPSTIVSATIDCETWCLHQGFNNPAVGCWTRGGPSAIGTVLAPGNYILYIHRSPSEGVCTGQVRVSP